MLACAWSSFPGLQSAQREDRGTADRPLVRIISCVGRLTRELLLDMLRLGVWGVLVIRCRAEDCTHGGSLRGSRCVFAVRAILDSLGIAVDRIQEREIGRGDTKAFSASVAQFMAGVRMRGPLSALDLGHRLPAQRECGYSGDEVRHGS